MICESRLNSHGLQEQEQQGIHRHQTPPQYRHTTHGRRCMVQPPCIGVTPITAKRDVIHNTIKPEVHNVAQRRWRRTKPQPQGIYTQNCAQIGPAVRIDMLTYRQTDRQMD